MKTNYKLAGIGLIVGAILQITRMIPIAMSDGIKMLENFPPHSLEETLFAAKLNGWFISHIMVFIATPLLMIGFYGLYKLIKNQAKFNVGVLGLFIIFLGLLLYTIGAVIDGFLLPELAHRFDAANGNEKEQLGVIINAMHHLAICFGGPSFTHLLLGTGFLGIALKDIKGFKIYGILAMVIGAIAFLGYITGILDLLVTKSFMLTGGLTTLLFFYLLAVGIRIFRMDNITE